MNNQKTAQKGTTPKTESFTPVKKLAEVDFEMTESVQLFMTAFPPAGTTRKDVLSPVFWSHVAKRLDTMAEIRMMPKDGDWYGVYLVTFCDKVQVQVQELAFYEINQVDDSSADLYFVEWVSPAKGVKFCVVRKSDNERISTGHDTKQAAVHWM